MAVMTRDAVDAIQLLLDGYLTALGRPAEVLEAGCGRFLQFCYPPGARVTGLDISQEQLDLNEHVHERLMGDVQFWKTDRTWDTVVSMYVLEHLDDPVRAVVNMHEWTRPGGLLVIGVPNLWSLRGLITKFTPFWFHKLAYQLVYRRTIPPFATTLKLSVAPVRLRGQLLRRGGEIVYEGWARETLRLPYRLLYEGLVWLGKIVTLGRWRPEDMNYYIVVRRG